MAHPGLTLVDDPIFDDHFADGPHPERPARLDAARAGVAESGVTTHRAAARDASDEELARVHQESYLSEFANIVGKSGYVDADTFFAPLSATAARRAAGGGLALVDSLLDGESPCGLALLRPPGHHARPAAGMGFCLLNHVAVAAAHARAKGAARVLIVDWDVHHGNGTQETFYDDPSVLYASVHQWPYYPGTGDVGEIGRGDGTGHTVNVPLSSGAGQAAYLESFDRVLLPICDQYRPDLLLVSAGFDAHIDDPLAAMNVDAATFGSLTRRLLSALPTDTPVGLFLEGGYNLDALRASVRETVLAAAGKESWCREQGAERGHRGPTEISDRHREEIARVILAQRAHWRI